VAVRQEMWCTVCDSNNMHGGVVCLDIEHHLWCVVTVLGHTDYFSTFCCKQKLILVFVKYKLFIYVCVL
jgi:hypothetical protein